MQVRKTSEERKKEALKAALKIIYEKGFSKLTIRGIAERLDISEAALYRHFDDKQDIIDQLTDLVFYQECTMEERDNENALTTLSEFIDKQAEKFEDNPFLSIISFQFEMFSAYPEIKAKFIDHQAKREQEIIDILNKGIKKGLIKEDINPAAFAQIFMGSIRVTVLKWKNSDFNYSLKDRLTDIKKELFKYIECDN